MTPIFQAMLHGDLDAVRLLIAAGAAEPQAPPAPTDGDLEAIRRSAVAIVPMLCVEDVDATVEWYTASGWDPNGFELVFMSARST